MEKILLGSGKVYVTLVQNELPEDLTTLAVEENRIGWIQGGATLEYKPTFYTTKDDLGMVTKETITEEEAIFKSGLLTWDVESLNKLLETGRVKTTEKYRILKIGGIANAKKQKYVILFHHEDKTDGDLYVAIVGSNQSGLTIGFAKDKETVVDAEFKASPMDNEGTLIQLIESLPAQPAG
ncbi:hypothetical protein [Thomasclavelia cocleata]|uniref:hypothetical protein n=1 Tax=Thomasclavelia cocleata TaxID=69824 RepID=UPI00257073CA|nr:hypothetical protein [Thomasclavelia cocleata]